MTTQTTLTPMQQELLSRADQILASIGASVSKASDAAIQAGQVVAKEIPDIASQYIIFGRAFSTVWLLIAIGALVLCYFWFHRIGINNTLNLKNSCSGDWHPVRFTYATGGVLIGAFGVCVFFTMIKDLILVWSAPKVWLMLELVNLMKITKG